MNDKLSLLVRLDALDRLSKPLRGAGKESAALNAQLRLSRDRVKALEASQRDIAAFRGHEEQIVATRMKLEQQRKTVAELGAAYRAADSPTKTLTRNFTSAREALARLEREEEQHRSGLRETEARLKATGVATADLARHEQRLAAEIADTNFQIRMQKDQLGDLAGQQRRMDAARARHSQTTAFAGSAAASGAGAIGAGMAAATPLVAARNAASDLEQQLITIAQRSNMNDAALARFETRMMSVGRTANLTREETITLLDDLTAQGFSPDDALVQAASIGKATTAYRLLAQDGGAAAGSLRNIKIAAADTGRAFDIMAVAGKRGNFEFDAMARAFPSLTANAAALQMTGEKAVAELAAGAQIVRRGAGSDDEAATNFENLLQKISSPETEKRFAKMGINLREALAAGAKEGKSALETIIELTNTATGGDLSKIGYLFEDAQVQKAMRPLIADFDEFKSIRDEALGAGNVIDADFQRRMRANGEATKAAGIAAGETAVMLGKHLLPVQTKVAHFATGVMTAFNAWAKDNPKLAGTLVTILSVVAGLLLAFGAVALIVSAVLAPISLLRLSLALSGGPLKAVTLGVWGAVRAFAAWTIALLANPMTWIVIGIIALVAAIAALGYGIYLVWKNWSTIGPMLGRVWQRICDGAVAAISVMIDGFLRFHPLGLLISAFMAVWPYLAGLGPRFAQLGRDMIAGLIDGVLGMLSKLKSTVTDVASKAAGWFKDVLGIRSPSRVFMAFGGHTMGGLALGIEQARNRPIEALGKVGAAMTGALAIGAGSPAIAGTGSGPGSVPIAGDIFNLTINTTPGMDVKAIADEVLKAIQKAQDSKRRSGFRDDEE